VQDKSWGGVRADLADSLISDQSLSISRYFDQLIAFFSTLFLEFFQKISNLYTYRKEKEKQESAKGNRASTRKIERVNGNSWIAQTTDEGSGFRFR
jgi:hypothetical protein